MANPIINSKIRLGEALQITISSRNLEKTLLFYQRLGFRVIARNSSAPNWARITDESIVLFFIEEEDPFIGLTYFCNNVSERVQILENEGLEFSHKEGFGERLTQAIIWNMNKIGIAIVKSATNSAYIPTYQSKSLCGKFTELSLQTQDFDNDYEKWLKLGFRNLSSRNEPVKSAMLTDDLIMIGLHETENWQQPSFVYTQKNMGKILNELVNNGLELAFTINDDNGNIVSAGAMAPEGTGFFFLESGD